MVEEEEEEEQKRNRRIMTKILTNRHHANNQREEGDERKFTQRALVRPLKEFKSLYNHSLSAKDLGLYNV